jgi:hypothetical protein
MPDLRPYVLRCRPSVWRFSACRPPRPPARPHTWAIRSSLSGPDGPRACRSRRLRRVYVHDRRRGIGSPRGESITSLGAANRRGAGRDERTPEP